ncbi:MAG: AMP-binding protein, partial [Acidimicrobiales bacterium]
MSGLSSRIAEVLAIDGSAGALEFEGTWWTYAQLADTVEQTASLVPGPGAEVGILLRNRPVSIGFLLGVLQADGCIVTINPGRGRDRTREDIEELALSVLCGQPDDLADLVPGGSRAGRLATTVAADGLGEPLVVEKGTCDGGAARPGVAVRMLTSGTTGPPKRVDLTYSTLEQVLVGNQHYGSTHERSTQLRRGVAVVNSPLVHLGGLFRVLSCVTDGRSFSFLE